MADQKVQKAQRESEDPQAYFIGDVLPSNSAESHDEPATWEEIDEAADQVLGQADKFARTNQG